MAKKQAGFNDRNCFKGVSMVSQPASSILYYMSADVSRFIEVQHRYPNLSRKFVQSIGHRLVFCSHYVYNHPDQECLCVGFDGMSHNELCYAAAVIRVVEMRKSELTDDVINDVSNRKPPCPDALNDGAACREPRGLCGMDHRPSAILNAISASFRSGRGESECAAIIDHILSTPTPDSVLEGRDLNYRKERYRLKLWMMEKKEMPPPPPCRPDNSNSRRKDI